MDQTTLRKIVSDFLAAHRKAVLATVGDDEHPTTSLMLYAADERFNVYFGTRKSFAKYRILQRHPYASLSIVEESVDPLRTVEIRGKIEFVAGAETAERLNWFTSKNPSEYYVRGASDFVMFRVVPSFVRWLDASSGELTMANVEL